MIHTADEPFLPDDPMLPRGDVVPRIEGAEPGPMRTALVVAVHVAIAVFVGVLTIRLVRGY